MSESSEQLFQRYRDGGSRRDLGLVFDRLAPGLYAQALKLSGSAADAEDLVQDTFLTAIQSADRFREGAEVGPWFGGILRKLALAKRSRAKTPDPLRLARTEIEPPEQGLATRESYDLMVGALESLPPSYRESLELHLLHGLTPKEVARDLGTRPGTVRARLSRGLDLMRSLIPAGSVASVMLFVAPRRGLAAVREVAFAKGASVAATTWIGALIMGKKTIAAACFGLLLIIAFVARGLGDDDLEPPLDDAAMKGGPEIRRAALEDSPKSSKDATLRSNLQVAANEVEVLATAPDGRRPVLQFLHADTGEPLPSVSVWIAPPEARRHLGTMDLDYDDARYARAYGRRYASDEQGRLVLSYRMESIPIWAEKDGLMFRDSVDPEDALFAPLACPLHPMKTIRVRVRDAERRPLAGVPLQLHLQDRTFAAAASTQLSRRELSGPDGVARFYVKESGYDSAKASFGFPLIDPPKVEVDDAGEAELVLHRWRSAELLVPEELRDQLGEGGRAELRASIRPNQMMWIQQLVRPIVDGRAVFPYLGEGVEFTLRIRAPSPHLDFPVERRPELDRENRACFVALPPQAGAQLRVRLLDSEGQPLSGLRCALEFLPKNEALIFEGDDVTDAEGWVRREADTSDVEDARGLRIEGSERVDCYSSQSSWEAWVTLPPPDSEGNFDFGEVRLQRPRAVIEGRILRADGSPAPGAEVYLLQEDPEDDDDFRLTWSDPELLRSGDFNPVRSNADGLFGFADAKAGLRSVIVARDAMHATTLSDEFISSETTPTLRLLRGSSLSCRLDGLSAELAHRATLEIKDAMDRIFSRPLPPQGGEFIIEGLAPGACEFRVMASNGITPYQLRLIELNLQEGLNQPQALHPLDLSSEAIHILQIHDERGRPLQAYARFEGGQQIYGDKRGRLAVFQRQVDAGLTLRAPGRLERLIENPRQVQVLRPGIPVHIRFTSPHETYQHLSSLLAELVPVGEAMICDSTRIGTRTQIVLRVPRPGRYRLFVHGSAFDGGRALGDSPGFREHHAEFDVGEQGLRIEVPGMK